MKTELLRRRPFDLASRFRAVHAVYTATHPRSDPSEQDYARQAVHLVAEACMACVSLTFGEQKPPHLADNVASCCRMARICASLHRGGEKLNFLAAEEVTDKEMETGTEILSKFLEEMRDDNSLDPATRPSTTAQSPCSRPVGLERGVAGPGGTKRRGVSMD